MRAELEERLKAELAVIGQKLKSPVDLMRRAVTPDDFADSAVIGGISVGDILQGKVAEWQIPSDVKEAFHAQYPQHDLPFVQAVNRLSRHPEALQGLINGVKGKLFEIDYVDWLNHGHLPEGFSAALAENATNPAWDVMIRDSHGNIEEVLQLKATASLSYVQETLAAHPDIDVVIPHELYDQLAGHPALGHLVDSHHSLHDLSQTVSEAANHAEAAAVHFHVPYIAIGYIAWQNCKRYRNGQVSLADACNNLLERSILSVIASGVGYAASAVAHKTIVGIPFAMGARLLGGQALHNREKRKVIDMHITIIQTSQLLLKRRFIQVPVD